MTLPAMGAAGAYSVTFDDGARFGTEASVPSVATLDRVATVAPKDSGLQIHALEFGATYGEPGHVWSENPGDPTLAATGGGGYILQLGDPELDNAVLSEVYTFPRAGSGESGVVRLSVEAEVTTANCATEIAGQSIEPGADGQPVVMEMTVAVPDCDAVGEYLVLKNLLRDRRVASSN